MVPEAWKQTEGALYLAAHPMASNSLAIGGRFVHCIYTSECFVTHRMTMVLPPPTPASLLFFLTIANVFSTPKSYEEEIKDREQLIAYLRRPIWEYTGDEVIVSQLSLMLRTCPCATDSNHEHTVAEFQCISGGVPWVLLL